MKNINLVVVLYMLIHNIDLYINIYRQLKEKYPVLHLIEPDGIYRHIQCMTYMYKFANRSMVYKTADIYIT